MFCLPNKFVLFTNHKQPLKCVQQKLSRLVIKYLVYYLTRSLSLSKVTGLIEKLINKPLTK